MRPIRYVLLIIATFTLQSPVIESSGPNNPRQKAAAPLKGENIARTGTSHSPFSFENIIAYVKNTENEASQFQRRLLILKNLLSAIQTGCPIAQMPPISEKVIGDWIAEKGEFPNFEVHRDDKSGTSAKDPHIGEKKVALLNKVLERKRELDADDKRLVGEWLAESEDVKNVVQRNFFSGEADGHTAALFDGLRKNDFDAAEDLVREFRNKLGPICEAISGFFFEPSVTFETHLHEDPTTGAYRCKAGTYDGERELHEIALCREDRNVDLFYFRVAVAKIERATGSFDVRYFVAFDRLKENTRSPHVAISFSISYKMSRDGSYEFKPDFSSLKGGKEKRWDFSSLKRWHFSSLIRGKGKDKRIV